MQVERVGNLLPFCLLFCSLPLAILLSPSFMYVFLISSAPLSFPILILLHQAPRRHGYPFDLELQEPAAKVEAGPPPDLVQ